MKERENLENLSINDSDILKNVKGVGQPGIDLKYEAQDRVQCQNLVNRVMGILIQ
jgi:hypothetical protein